MTMKKYFTHWNQILKLSDVKDVDQINSHLFFFDLNLLEISHANLKTKTF